jgi:hypothetical protein
MVIYSRFPSLFLDDKEAYGKEARSCATVIKCHAHGVSQRCLACWLFPKDSIDTATIVGLWWAPTFCQNPEAASWEHLSLACAGGHLREVYDQLCPPLSPGDRGYRSEVDLWGRNLWHCTRSFGRTASRRRWQNGALTISTLSELSPWMSWCCGVAHGRLWPHRMLCRLFGVNSRGLFIPEHEGGW